MNKSCVKHNSWLHHFKSDDVIIYIQNDVVLISIKLLKTCPRKLCAPPPQVINKLTLKRACDDTLIKAQASGKKATCKVWI